MPDLQMNRLCSLFPAHSIRNSHAPLSVPFSPTRYRHFIANTNVTAVWKCPAPSYQCAAAPDFPADKPIDFISPLTNTIPNYRSHMLISTGRIDWASKIDLDARAAGTGGLNVAAELKRLLQGDPDAGGIIVANSSFSVSRSLNVRAQEVEVHLFPQGRVASKVPPTTTGLKAFVSGCMSNGAESAHDENRAELQEVTSTTILICSHASRDIRCGILGPLLRDEFEKVLQREGVDVLAKPSTSSSTHVKSPLSHAEAGKGEGVSVGLVSHVGGHKWAGNVIIYFPPRSLRGSDLAMDARALEGKGVWYGRVEPKHVEGLVRETVLGGKVIRELCRGIV